MNNIKYIKLNPNNKFNLIHTTKNAGNMKDINNINNLLNELNINNKILVKGNQTHSNNILVVDKNTNLDNVVEIDGLITNDPNFVLLTLYADCLPIFIFDNKKEIFGVLHAGWRGSVAKILENGINIFKNKYKSNINDIIISFGICISKNIYEVKQDLVDNIKSKFEYNDIFIFNNNKIYLDLQQLNYNIAIENGILEKNIYKNDYCTYNGNFYSYRKDKTTNRCAAIIYKMEN